MSKKGKSQKDIRQYIYDDYIFNRELESTVDVLKHIELLVDNNLATHISGKEDMSYTIVSNYRIASMLMCKFNKSLKKRKRKPLEHEYIKERITGDSNEEIIKLGDEGLDIGIYYADLGNGKHDDYAILQVSHPDPDDPYIIGYDLYFVGYRHLKYKNKFFKLVDKYKKYNDDQKYECIMTVGANCNYKDTQFKSFDRMVFTNKEKIIDYIDNWVTNIPYYFKYEMTPKLSILLYGEPGTGKSTFCSALAKYLGIDTVAKLQPDFFSADTQNGRGRYLNGTMIYALDDIDCLCKSRDDSDDTNNSKTLAALLEFLDNPNTFYYKAKDGKYYPISIVVATTNYYEKLDPAVKRYGRFDLKVEMKPFNEAQAEEMCALYDLKLKDVYHEKINKDFTISPAYLQALCMENIDNAVKKL